jgi:hypothetical protein
MPLLEGKTPSERKKTIAAILLGGLALVSLGYMFLGSSASSGPQAGAKPSPKRSPVTASVVTPDQVRQEFTPTVLVASSVTPSLPEAGRNIFAFYVPPTPTPTPVPTPIPTPTPVPPNVVLASISPVNVFAHTGEFTMDITGDKFTPETRVYMGGGELPTRFVSPQQLSTNVPAQLLSFEGAREIEVRSRDGKLFSNKATLNVMPAPVPSFVLIGVTLRRGSNDTAILKEKSGKELLTVQRGDILAGRFRVTSISAREVTLTDTTLKLKHPLPLVGDNSNPGAQGQRYTPPPPPSDDDTEP